jgi:adenine-specific DNA-methyltransferase
MTAATSPLQSIQTPDLLQERLARLKAEFPDLFTNEGQLNPAELLRLTGQQGREHFDFSWAGKSAAKRKAFTPTTAALRYDAARSVNPDKAGGNAIIEGENLEVLKLLLCAYRGQVKCIYIDPPYNTGNDFVYKDNFKEGERAYWEQTGVTQDGVKMSTNTKSDGRFHSNWLNMIYPRLLVARQLLREDGVIFVSIDDNEVTHLRKVMDEVFGEGNALVSLIWDKQHSQQQGVFKKYHEYVVCYAKSAEIISKIEGGEGNIEAGALKKISKSNPASEFTFPKGVRFDAKDGTTLKGAFGASEQVTVVKGVLRALNGKTAEDVTLSAGWTQKNQMRDYFGGKEVRDTKNQLVKEFFFNSTGKLKCIKERVAITPSSLLPKFGMSSVHTAHLSEILEGEIFDNPKPVDLIQLLLSWFLQEGDIFLDFFAGSGSSAEAFFSWQAEMAANAKFIGVQIPEATDEKSEAYKAGFKKISDITIERVKRVIQGYGNNPQPIDAGFKVFILEKSAFPRSDFAPDPDATEAMQLEALKAFIADKEASLFSTLDAQAVCDEVLLKCGFQLDVQLTPIAEVTANQLFRAHDQQTPPRQAIVCFDPSLDTSTLEWLGHQKGHRVIVLESALTTTGKWNLHHELVDALTIF